MTLFGFCGIIKADLEGRPPQPKKSRIYWENPFQLRHFLAHHLRPKTKHFQALVSGLFCFADANRAKKAPGVRGKQT